MVEKINIDKTNSWPFVEAKKILKDKKKSIEKKGKITLLWYGEIREGEFDDNGNLYDGKITYPCGVVFEGEFNRAKLGEDEIELKNGRITHYDGIIEEGEFHENGYLKKGKIT